MLASRPYSLQRHLFQAQLAKAAVAMALVDGAGQFLEINGALSDFLGRDSATLIGMSLLDVIVAADLERPLSPVAESVADRHGSLRISQRFRHADGRLLWGEASVAPMRLPESDSSLFIVQITDLREAVRGRDAQRPGADHGAAEVRPPQRPDLSPSPSSRGRLVSDDDGIPITPAGGWSDPEQELRIRGEGDNGRLQDPLTGLPIRGVMLDRVEAALAERENCQGVVVMSVGINHLTLVNDAYTHAVGDLVIVKLAGRLAQALGPPHQLGRGTGDEFIVLLSGIHDEVQARRVGQQLRRACQGPMAVARPQVNLDPTVSIGIARRLPGCSAAELLRDASQAMRRASALGRDRVEIADPGQSEAARRLLTRQDEIRNGLACGELRAWYMPVVDFASGQTRGHEALARWIRPDGSVVCPDAFLPAIQQCALASALDREILRQSIAVLATLPDGQTMAANVAATTLASPDFAAYVAALLAAAAAQPERLILELTETALLTVDDVVRDNINALAALGIRWYVDDFGTGYASISYLRDLPIRGLKLDRSFTSAIAAGDLKSLQLALALAGLAQGLQLETVAEGIETLDDAVRLQSQGWLHGQGCYFGKAAPQATVCSDTSRPEAGS